MASRAFVLALCAAGVAADLTSDPDWAEFHQFVEKYNRVYSSPAEVAGRFAIFKDNLVKIKARNVKDVSVVHGVNNFADLTHEEFKAKYTGYRHGDLSSVPMKTFPEGEAEAKSIDWREKGAVTPIKNQGQCGSCWAFSATEQIESEYFLKYGKLPVLAPQQIVSCDTTCDGCGGGWPIDAYKYVMKAGGQDSESSYPYVSGITGQSGTCTTKPADYDASDTAGTTVSSSAAQEGNMLKQVQESPISIAVDAQLWQTYVSGVITANSGCGTQLDHAVQIVGYNQEQNYWIVRNSWGTSWGNEGYIYVQEGHNVCGIALAATITGGAKPKVEV